MELARFFEASRVMIVAGKGGVGKTTVTAALARMAALEGTSTLVIEVERDGGLGPAMGADPLEYDEAVVWRGAEPGAADVRGRALSPDDALQEYLEDHGLRRVSKRLVATGAMDVVATAAPGIQDILVLGKVKQLERASAAGARAPDGTEPAELIVLDAPAAGHAVSFLLAARALLDAARAGPVHTQARDVLEMLGDPARCSVLLVTLPEETPVNELVETAYDLEDRVGVHLGPVVVNGLLTADPALEVDPEAAAAEVGAMLRPGEAEALAAAAGFRRARQELQAAQVERLAARLPLPQLHLPDLLRADIGRPELDRLAAALRASVLASGAAP